MTEALHRPRSPRHDLVRQMAKRVPRIMKSRFVFVGLVLVAGAGLAGCTMSAVRTSYLSERACLAHAKQTLYDADFAENLTVSPERSSVSGRHGGYDATVTCDPAGHLAVVDVHGLDPDQIDWYRSTITKKF